MKDNIRDLIEIRQRLINKLDSATKEEYQLLIAEIEQCTFQINQILVKDDTPR